MKKSYKLSKGEPICLCKDGWCLGLGQEGSFLCEGKANFLKYVKREWNRKKGREKTILKRGDQAGNHLRTMLVKLLVSDD